MGGTGGSGGALGRGGGAGGAIVIGDTGGSIGTGGVGGASACPPSAYPVTDVCCLALVTHDPLTEPFVCNESTGTWGCGGSQVRASSVAGCISGTIGTGGSVGSGGGGGIGGQTGSGGIGGSRFGTPYACVGGFVLKADGGETLAPADAGTAATCVVGQSYCQAESLDKVVGVEPEHTCRTLSSDGGLGVCTDTPTCACICSQGVICTTECSCNDTLGLVVITCHQV